MNDAVRRLFTIIRDGMASKQTYSVIREAIISDESLIEASNSYCSQCGWCCGDCENMSMHQNELAYCMLHDAGPYPNGKKIPDFPMAKYNELDPEEWAKPLLCHTHGPYVALLSTLMGGKEYPCEGSKTMKKDYRRFRKKNIKGKAH